MNLTSRLKPYNTPLTLVVGILLLGVITQLLGVSLLTRIITVMFVSLILVKDELPLGLIAENLPANGFRHRWHIGNPLLNGMAYGAGGNYRIQVQWQSNPNPGTGTRGSMPANAPAAADLQKNSDRSDGVFSISPGKGNKEAKAKEGK